MQMLRLVEMNIVAGSMVNCDYFFDSIEEVDKSCDFFSFGFSYTTKDELSRRVYTKTLLYPKIHDIFFPIPALNGIIESNFKNLKGRLVSLNKRKAINKIWAAVQQENKARERA